MFNIEQRYDLISCDMYICVWLQDGGGNNQVVKCINWKIITDQTRSILPSDYLDEADILLHTSPNADTVFTAEACQPCL